MTPLPKPVVSLTHLENIVVNTPTQQDYDTLMRVYECGGRVWRSGVLPTKKNWSELWGSETVIHAENYFGYADKFFCREQSDKKLEIILPEDFYEIQSVSLRQILQINRWFETEV